MEREGGWGFYEGFGRAVRGLQFVCTDVMKVSLADIASCSNMAYSGNLLLSLSLSLSLSLFK